MIELQDLTRLYGGVAAVKDVSLAVPEGRIATLVGASGSGKTTLLRLINRLVEPSRGRVLIGGVDSATIPVHRLRRRIGYAIQGDGLFPHRSVAGNIATVPRLLGWPRPQIDARIDELLDLFQLDPAVFRDRMPHQLSGGQAQRVGVARALAAKPDLLLMDEPFGALDSVIRARAQQELRDIQRRLGTTVILVTHDIDEAIRLGDLMAVMDRGRVVQFAPPAEVLRAPASDFVRALTGPSERAFRLLSLIPASDLARAGEAAGPALAAGATLRDALAECLLSGRSALPLAEGGIVLLDDLRQRAGQAGA